MEDSLLSASRTWYLNILNSIFGLNIGIGVALVVWLANPEPAYAPETSFVPPTGIDPNYGDKAYFDAAPGTGDISDIYAVVTGHTLFTGEEVDRFPAALFAILPLASSSGFRQGYRFIQGIDTIIPGTNNIARRIANPLKKS